MPRPLRVGLLLPHWSGTAGVPAPRWPEILAMARQAENAGFDSLWVADTILARPGGPESMGFWECWSLLGALAASTSRADLGSLVTGGFRNPVLVANHANTVDEISGGRLVLGIGAGDSGQYHYVGMRPDGRFGRLEETLGIVRPLLAAGRAGAFELPLRGPRDSGPPIMLGSYPQPGPRMRRLAAEHADGWNAWLAFHTASPAALADGLRGLDAACEAAGRDPATLWRSAVVGVAAGGGPLRFGAWDITAAALSGAPERIAEGLRGFAAAGVAHVQLYAGHPAALDELARVLDVLDA